MKNDKAYKIRQKATGKFWDGRGYWSDTGKTYSKIGHVKNGLNHLMRYYHTEREVEIVEYELVPVEEIAELRNIEFMYDGLND